MSFSFQFCYFDDTNSSVSCGWDNWTHEQTVCVYCGSLLHYWLFYRTKLNCANRTPDFFHTSMHSLQNVLVLLRTATRYKILNSARTDLSKAADNTCAEVSLDPWFCQSTVTTCHGYYYIAKTAHYRAAQDQRALRRHQAIDYSGPSPHPGKKLT